MSAPASASSAPPPSSLPINKDKGALTMLVKPASPGADLAALAAQIRGLEVRGVRWAQQFGVEGVGYGLDELTVTAFVPPDQTTDAGAWRGEARRERRLRQRANAAGRGTPPRARGRAGACAGARAHARARGRTRGPRTPRLRLGRASARSHAASGGSAQRGRRPPLTPRARPPAPGEQSWTPCATSRARRATTRASRASVRKRAAGLTPASPALASRAPPRPLTLTLTLSLRRDPADLVAFQQA
jgi:translation elongation factor EF-1beta